MLKMLLINLKQQRKLVCGKLLIREEPDNCIFLTDMSVVIVRNIVKTYQNQTVVIGQIFLVQGNCFEYPVPSSDIYEFKVSTLSEIQAWNISDVMCKAVKLPDSFPHGRSFIVFPLMRQYISFSCCALCFKDS